MTPTQLAAKAVEEQIKTIETELARLRKALKALLS